MSRAVCKMKTTSARRVRLMDAASITARIEQAIRHAADGNRLINRQREIIAGLEQNGSNVVQALALLKNLLFSQNCTCAIEITFTGFFRNIILKNRRLPRPLQISCKQFAR